MNKQIATINQVVENTNEKKKDRREGKGRVLAISRMVYRLQKTDTFYVESETRDDQYYFVKFKPDVVKGLSCSCRDNSIRGLKCKHLWGIESAIKWGLIKDIDKVPAVAVDTAAVDKDTFNNIQTISTKSIVEAVARRTESYLEDDYDF